MTSRKISTAIGAMCMLTLATGVGTAFASPASATAPAAGMQSRSTSSLKGGGMPVEPSQVIDAGKELFDFLSRCENNREHDIPCLQSSDETINDIYSMLKEFTAKYEADQERTQEAFAYLAQQSDDQSIRAARERIDNDFEVSHTGMKMLNAYADCTRVIVDQKLQDAKTGSDHLAGTCANVNTFGVDQKPQPATPQALAELKAAIVANAQGHDSIPGYQENPAVVMQKIGGRSETSAYADGDSLLHLLIQRRQDKEDSVQKAAPGTPLHYFSAAYVNDVGTITNRMVDEETAYLTTRVATARMEGKESLANDLSDLAANGRGGGSPILGLDQQRRTYVFPGWTPTNQLETNQAYVTGAKSGGVLITNYGSSKRAPVDGAANLPSPELLRNFGADFGKDYQKLQAIYPTQLPAIQGQLENGDAAQVARLWTAAQPTWKANLKSYNGGKLKQGANVRSELPCVSSANKFTPENCKISDSPEVTVLGNKVTGKDAKGNWTEVDVPSSAITTKSVPFNIFASPSDERVKMGDRGPKGQTNLDLSKHPELDTLSKALGGSAVTVQTPQTGAVSADLASQGYRYTDIRWDQGRHHYFFWTENGGANQFGGGLLVNENVTAGTVGMTPVALGGALQ